MTPEQIRLARHALGLGDGICISYRNRYVAGPGHPAFADWQAMVEAGMEKQLEGYNLRGGSHFFYLTKEGATAALKKGEKLDPEDFPG